MSELALQQLRSEVAKLVYERGFVAPRLFYPSTPLAFFGLIIETSNAHSLLDLGDLEADITDLVRGPVEVLAWSGVRSDLRQSLLQQSEPL